MEFSSDNELLEYLMTSDFISDDLSPEEYADLLFRFRHFFRLEHAKRSSLNYKLDTFENEISLRDKKIEELEKSLENESLRLKKLKNKKLTFKERFKGKIIS